MINLEYVFKSHILKNKKFNEKSNFYNIIISD